MPNSPTPNAPKNYDEIVKLLENDTKVKVAGQFGLGLYLIETGIDVDGVLRGKIMSKSKFLSCIKSDGQFGFCSVIFGWDRASPFSRREDE
jgi:glutamine synthetase